MDSYEVDERGLHGRMDGRGAKQEDAVRRDLAERAKQGDTEAFGELIERHRDEARRWAERMTGDPHLADDIVQDALIRAFLHVGKLADTSRFLPWLHRIVRNQAYMRLRRGGPYGREQPFAAFGASRSDSGHGAGGGHESVDWEDLDGMLFHLTRSAADASAKEQDPAEHLMRKELYETIHALLHCLTRKERSIFEAHFFRQLGPEEIAAMYRMTTGSVYTYIHRSRRKLRQEHLRVSLGLLPAKGERGLTTRCKTLGLPDWPAHAALRFTFIDRIGHMLASAQDRRETAELMGKSNFAFRMQISDKTTYGDGIYMFDWRERLQALMEELGYEITLLCGQLASSPVPLLGAVERFPVVLPIEEAVLPFIRKYIDLGKPVLYFDTSAANPYVHEWSLIYGYDDGERRIRLTDGMRPGGKTLPYEDVADNPVRFLAGIDGKLAPRAADETSGNPSLGQGAAFPDHAAEALRTAAELARSGGGYRPMTSYLSYSHGLAAYDCWIRHLRQGPASPPNRYGMGQLAAVYAETKDMAARYLRGLPLHGEAMRLTLLASEAYEQSAEALAELSRLVPFVRGAGPLAPEECESCAVLLERAKTFEAAAIEYMEKAYHEFMEETEQ